mmetsp:Transcript_9996/g.24908  ORF Transcript_9996/g.24908 Transcript_9996/m.24908 type:complete len:289 (-) Transcript_9996:49-915(-)
MAPARGKQQGSPSAAAASAAAKGQSDSVKLDDGSVLQIARLPEVDETTWGEMKNYLESNPEIAKGLRNFSKNPDAMRGWLQTQALAEHYESQVDDGNDEVQKQMETLCNDEDFCHVFDEIKRTGLGATMKYWNDEEMLLKLSARIGGVPEEVSATLQKIEDTPLSLHEAARNGNCKSIADFIKKGASVDLKDAKGVAPLGHAIGGNKMAAVKSLIDRRADPRAAVDKAGNTTLHYAAGYGWKELVEYFLRAGVAPEEANAEGQTSLDLARLNGHQACAELLEQRGAAS